LATLYIPMVSTRLSFEFRTCSNSKNLESIL